MEGKLLETFVTSSVLIVAVLILRRLCRGKISLCLQYGIWLIVAVKLLLVPAPFWGSSFSVMNLIKTDTQEAPAGRNLEKIPGTDTNSETAYIFYDSVGSDRDAGKADTEGVTQKFIAEERSERSQNHLFAGKEESRYMGSGSGGTGGFFNGFLKAVPFLLYMNACLLIVWMFFHNMRFYRRLRSVRIPYEAEGNGKEGKTPKIFLVEDLKTPCLYGTSIYLPIDVPTDEKKLRHILAHETAHYRHKDYIWAFVRLLCSALNWYNPLVWIAAAAQKQDCELACDESAIKALGEEERIPYGETLIRLVREKTPQDVLTISTTMTANAKEIKTRIALLAKKPVTVTYVAVITGIVLAAAVFCTFTGKAEAAEGTRRSGGTEKAEHYDPDGQSDITNGSKDILEDGNEAKHTFAPAAEGFASGAASADGTAPEEDTGGEGSAEKAASKEYTDKDLTEEFARLIQNHTFSVYVRSISRSARQIDLFSLPKEVWDHAENPSDYGELVFSKDCEFHLYNFNPEFGQMELYDTDFNGFTDKMSWDGVTEVECKAVCKDELITDIVAYNTYFGITYSEPVEQRDYYDLHGTDGFQLAGTYPADVSDAEGMEKIKIYKGNMEDGERGYVIVEKQQGADGEPKEILWIEEAHTDRDGWNNVYVGGKDGETFLLTLRIDIRDGYGTLAYHAFRLDAEGKPVPYNGARFMYEAETYKEENFEQWYRSLSVYLEHSYLLLSTQNGILRTGPGAAYEPFQDGSTVDNDLSDTTVPHSSHTFIPAPEEGGYELIELKEWIGEGIY